jgi:hypothetical protein
MSLDERLVRIETKQDAILSRIEFIHSDIKDHENRLRDLERSHWKIATFSGTIGAVAGFIAGIIKTYLVK